MTCKCEAFKKNMKEINDIILFASTHKIFYKGDEFDYCPWCGNELRQNEYEPDEWDYLSDEPETVV